MLNSLFVLGTTGHIVFEKHWREVVPRRAVEEFWAALQQEGGLANAPPAQSVGRLIMMHAARGPLLIVGAVGRDVPALVVLELLHRVGDLLELYLRELNEQAMRANFVTVYQLLDEVIDNGAPLHTEPNVLQELVMQPGKMEQMVASVTGASQVRGALPESTTSIAPWRRSGVRYAANEIYIDLNERLDATVDGRNGVLQRAEVWGEAQCMCQLSGMPRLTLAFTSPHIIEDLAMHPCVAKERWERERVMTFVPPDGKFVLFSYHVARTHQLPLYVNPSISFTPSSAGAEGGERAGSGGVGHMNIVVGARPTDGKPIDDVSVRIPLPASTVSTSLTASHGVVVYDDVAKELIWKIGRLPKDRTPSLHGTVNLGATGRTAQDLSLSLFVTFKVAMYSASGLKVASLRLENEEAQPYKGVRSVTRAGCFEVRC